jgi:hypothetical protein
MSTNPFPPTDLSLQTIGVALGLTGPSYSLGDLLNKNVYLADGTRVPVTESDRNIGFFRGKYSTPPPIGPIPVTYTTTGIKSPPAGKARSPTRIDVLVSGGGGGGGGGEEAEFVIVVCVRGEDGVTGGNGYITSQTNINYTTASIIDITAIGNGGDGGDGGDTGGGGGLDGDPGDPGGTTTITIGGTPYSASGGQGGGGGGTGGGGAGHRGSDGQPGYVTITWYYDY